MPPKKEISIVEQPGAQFIRTTMDMGRFLMIKSVEEIVIDLGGGIKSGGVKGANTLDIEPPVPKENLAVLGEQLVALANQLDPSPPPATYAIKKQ